MKLTEGSENTLNKKQPVEERAKQIRILAMDLDGTLLDSSGNLPERNRNAVMNAREAGYVIVFVTGRAFVNLPQKAMGDYMADYAITCTGAKTTEMRMCRPICESLIEKGSIELMKDIFSDRSVMTEVFIDDIVYAKAVDLQYIDDFGPSAARWREHKLKSRVKVTDMDALMQESIDQIQKFNLLSADEDKLDRILAYLNRSCSVSAWMSEQGCVEVEAQGTSKAAALKKLADMLGYGMQRVCSFGDSVIDKEMLQSSSIGVAMANGYGELKKIADVIAPSNDECGVAAILEKLFGVEPGSE